MNAEAEVISAICSNKDIASVLQDSVDDLFRSHKDVWSGLKSYYYKYRAVPDVSILEEKFGNFEHSDITEPTPFYLDRLREDYIKSKLEEVLVGTAEKLQSDSASRSLESLQTDIAKLSQVSRVVKDIDVTDYESAEKHYDRLRKKTDELGGTPGIKTGIEPLDVVYPTGFGPGHLITMIGYSGRSKSWAAFYFACKAFEQGYSPMIVSLEMSPEECRDRIYGLLGEGNFRVSDFQRGYINSDDFQSWGKRILDPGPRFTIVSTEGKNEITPNVIQAKIDQHKPDFVIVDYIQLMTDNSKTKGTTEKVTQISSELKQLAMRNDIPVMAISAVTDTENDNQDGCPRLNQVAWGKRIQYDTDLSIAVHKHKDTDIIEFLVEKNRRGSQAAWFMKSDLDRGIIEYSFEGPQ